MMDQAARGLWEDVEGFRFVEVLMEKDGTYAVLFEDDNAPPELEGKHVTPTFRMTYDPVTMQYRVTVMERRVHDEAV